MWVLSSNGRNLVDTNSIVLDYSNTVISVKHSSTGQEAFAELYDSESAASSAMAMVVKAVKKGYSFFRFPPKNIR